MKPPVLPPLPADVSYLQPVVDELACLAGEEINEDLEIPALEQLVRTRIQGLPVEDSRRRLDADSAALQAWIEEDERVRSFAAFVVGWLLGLGTYDRDLKPDFLKKIWEGCPGPARAENCGGEGTNPAG